MLNFRDILLLLKTIFRIYLVSLTCILLYVHTAFVIHFEVYFYSAWLYLLSEVVHHIHKDQSSTHIYMD